MLDTDICIELIKHNERVLDKVEAVGEENCFVTDITIAELFFGAAKSARPDHFDDVDSILQSFDLKPLLPSLRLYGENKALLGFCINLGGNSIPISTRCTASWLLAPLAWLC